MQLAIKHLSVFLITLLNFFLKRFKKALFCHNGRWRHNAIWYHFSENSNRQQLH